MLTPLHDYVLIRQEKQDSNPTTPSGLILPENSKPKPTRGEIVSVGEGKRDDNGNLIPMTLKAGDTVLYQRFTEFEIEHEGEKLLLVKQDNVLAIIS